MIKKLALHFAFLICASGISAQANVLPAGFHWVDLHNDKKIVDEATEALKREKYTALREIGVRGNHALVMTAFREDDAPTTDYDFWTIYDLNLLNGKIRILLNGYGVKQIDWYRLTPASESELFIQYLHCWECEATTILTSLRFTEDGWKARWQDQASPAQPGIPIFFRDVGIPYTDEEVTQVYGIKFAELPDQVISIGSWFRSFDLKTKRLTDTVTAYSVDPKTGIERKEQLSGKAALNMERTLCQLEPSYNAVMGGQDSRACAEVLRKMQPER